MMNILKPPTDEEFFDAISKMTTEELFESCCNGMDYNGDVFQLAVDRGLFLNDNPEGIFIKSAKGGSVKYLKLAIELGVEKNFQDDDGFTGLMYAANHGHLDVLKYLIDNGADINSQDSEFGTFPLKRAVEGGHIDCVQYLIAAGADINLRDKANHTALFAAYMSNTKNRQEIINYLKIKGGKK